MAGLLHIPVHILPRVISRDTCATVASALLISFIPQIVSQAYSLLETSNVFVRQCDRHFSSLDHRDTVASAFSFHIYF